MDVLLHAVEGLAVGLRADIAAHRCLQRETGGVGGGGSLEQFDQALALGLGQAWVKQQLAVLELVVADQRPGIQAKTGIGQAQVVDGNAGQMLQAPAEVVAQVADQATGKR
ncbi:hypothetical protein D9M71_515190 [compost metagenome]